MTEPWPMRIHIRSDATRLEAGVQVLYEDVMARSLIKRCDFRWDGDSKLWVGTHGSLVLLDEQLIYLKRAEPRWFLNGRVVTRDDLVDVDILRPPVTEEEIWDRQMREDPGLFAIRLLVGELPDGVTDKARRSFAALFHPDLATEPAQRRRLEVLMKGINYSLDRKSG